MNNPSEQSPFPMRLNKYLAHKNYASRRKADELIQDGLVTINGKTAQLGDTVNEDDTVTVAGHEQKPYVYYMYYKPRGVVTVNAQEGEKEIKDVAPFAEDVFPIGRLDKDSEGLIIMTNDGRITASFLSPESHTEKEYFVEVDRPLTHDFLLKMKQGIAIDVGSKKYITKPAQVRRVSKTSFDIVITEGKNRQIRKMCGAHGYKVTKLKRFRIDEINLEKMKPGQYVPLDFEVG